MVCLAIGGIRRTLGATLSVLIGLVMSATVADAGVAASGGILGKGTPWETAYYIQTSDRPGPTVVIVGGMRGDEPAGAAAADQIRRWPIRAGKLIVLPRANPPVLAAGAGDVSNAGSNVSALDRSFPRAGHPGPGIGAQAQAIWRWVEQHNPMWILDLREAWGVRGADSKSVGSSVAVQSGAEAKVAAEKLLAAVNATIDRPEKKFVCSGPPADGSLARAAGEHLRARAMTLRTSIDDLPPPSAKTTDAHAKKAHESPKPRKQPLSRRVRQHRIMVYALLAHLHMIDPQLDVDLLPGKDVVPEKVNVALYDAGGTGGQGGSAVERILGDAGMRVVRCGPEEIIAGTLKQFHLVVFPGGSGRREATALDAGGREAVRQFVQRGGAYMGICAGAYLCISGYDWSLGIFDAKPASPKWNRGAGMLKMELTPEGRPILGNRPGLLDVRYHNGPVITRANIGTLPDYEVLAYFRTEVAKNNTPAGVMVDSPAIAVARYGKGRVVFISPHPEQTRGVEDLVLRAGQWAISPDGGPKGSRVSEGR
jgi:putative intracellular protease/amidase